MSSSPRDLTSGSGRERSISVPSAPMTIKSPLPQGRTLSTGNSFGSIRAPPPVVEFHTSFDFNNDDVDDRGRARTKLVSTEDAKLAAELHSFMDGADVMLNRVESRRRGYNNFKQLKKQASAVKHTIRNALFGKKRTKLDELKDLADSLLLQYEKMRNVFMERTVVALDVQQALMEQSQEYRTRLNGCTAHNKEVAKRLHSQWKETFAYVCKLDDHIKSFTQALVFQDEVASLKSRDTMSSFSGAYIPWALRAEVNEEEEKTKLEEHAQKKEEEEARVAADAKTKEEYLRRIEVLSEARTASRTFMDDLMQKREGAEDTLKRLQDTNKYLTTVREELLDQEIERSSRATEIRSSIVDISNSELSRSPALSTSIASSLDDSALNTAEGSSRSSSSCNKSKEWGHSECADCNVVHGIARGCGDHLVASYYKAEENAKQLNELLVRGDALRAARTEIEVNFTAWGDLPQSYSGGVY